MTSPPPMAKRTSPAKSPQPSMKQGNNSVVPTTVSFASVLPLFRAADGPHAFALAVLLTADIRRQRVERLGQQHRTACLTQPFSRFSHVSSSGLPGSS